MRRTNWPDLAAPFAVIAMAVYVLVRVRYDSLPPLQYAVPVPLAALALVELVVSRRVRSAVRHVRGAKPMTAIAIARCVALGKASALVGAGVVGAAVAVLGYVLPDVAAIRAARHDALVALLLLGAALLLTVAGLTLERAGIDPGHGRRRD